MDNQIQSLASCKKFRYFRNEIVLKKLILLCGTLSQPEILEIVIDFLLDIYFRQPELRKEATFLINEILSTTPTSCDKKRKELIRTVINIYLEPDNWNLIINTDEDEYGVTHSLGEVQNNILQLCLQLEGIGKMALVYQFEFRDLLLKTMYPVLENAGSYFNCAKTLLLYRIYLGSGIPHLKQSGLQAILNISRACGYENIMDLINKNSDYFSFHITRKLKLIAHNNKVLDVFSVVMKYSTIEILPSISGIADGVNIPLQFQKHFFLIRFAFSY